MPHHTPLIGTIVAGLVFAFVLGALAHRLRVSPIAGYLLAGVLVGPFTPGFVADSAMASELAEIGVILLMFGVGLHFSVRDLMEVRKVALPGAIAQSATATALGVLLGLSLGWSLMAGLVFGLALSVASTVVLLRALESRNLVETERGRIAIGWLIVEDIFTVLALVMLPAIAGAADGQGSSPALSFGTTIVKLVAFVALMALVGRRVIPWALHWVVHTGSRELFRLAVLAIALGVAFGASYIFGVSFALGAFFAGMILGETQLSRRATEETLPLRDAFAVLFFVSVGMLFDPSVVVEQPLALLATLAIIIVGKSLAAYAIVRAFGRDNQTAIAISASLAQIGEFSFILASLGTDLAILPSEGRDLILAGAIISILLHPFIFSVAAKRARRADATAEAKSEEGGEPHIIVVGYGRVGKSVGARLKEANRAFVLIDDETDVIDLAKQAGLHTVRGNAASKDILDQAGIQNAGHLLIAIPEGFEAGGIAEIARKTNPALKIIARAHSKEEVQHLLGHGADRAIMGEEEIARQLVLSAV